jgi:hypothetical protein
MSRIQDAILPKGAAGPTDCSITLQIAQSLKFFPSTLPLFTTGRRSFPPSRPAAVVQALIA